MRAQSQNCLPNCILPSHKKIYIVFTHFSFVREKIFMKQKKNAWANCIFVMKKTETMGSGSVDRKRMRQVRLLVVGRCRCRCICSISVLAHSCATVLMSIFWVNPTSVSHTETNFDI